MNMKKEYRAELRILDRAKRKLAKDLNNHDGKCWREIKRIQRSMAKGHSRVQRELDRIERRRAILQGRLS